MANSAPIAQQQLQKLREIIGDSLSGNSFQKAKLDGTGIGEDLNSLEFFSSNCPFTTKDELCADQLEYPPGGTNFTFSSDCYTRFCRTSGTTGQPLTWLDTENDWQWMLDSWKQVFRATGAEPGDRAFFPFSFGPFLGFWTAFEAAQQCGILAIPGGGMGSKERLELLLQNMANILCVTPTYAVRLAEAADELGINLKAKSLVRTIIVAGEPGGCIPQTRARIESLWPEAHVFDHHGMTETGPVTYQLPDEPNKLRVIQEAYYAEVLDPKSLKPINEGQTGELVLTTLGRTGSPLLRYRTGDLVCPRFHGEELILEGGILGRVDDMVIIRGVNLYPSAVEAVLSQLSGIAEYRVYIDKTSALPEIRLEIEPTPDASANLTEQATDLLRNHFLLRIPVELVPAGSLPRFELKARRWVINQ